MEFQHIKDALTEYSEDHIENLTEKDIDQIAHFINTGSGTLSEDDLSSIIEDIRIFESFSDYINHHYYNTIDYKGATGPAMTLVNRLEEMVLNGYETVSTHDALILNPDNTLKLKSGKYIVIL
jgi:hypothetical protein